jgi:hypothetical protein
VPGEAAGDHAECLDPGPTRRLDVWVVDPVYRGPLLIRGRQLDGPNRLRFDKGVVPPREIRIGASAPPRQRPSYTRVKARGCYAYQVDGVAFTRVIVFEARPLSAPGRIRTSDPRLRRPSLFH